MAAIFYDAVAATLAVKKLYFNPTYPGRININIEGANPGYVKGDKVLYKNPNGSSFTGAIIEVYNIPVDANWPKGGVGLGLLVERAAMYSGVIGGTVSPVTTAAVVKPAAPPVAPANSVVSAATILKGGDSGTATPAAPSLAVAKGNSGMSTGFYIGAGIITAVAAWLVFRKKK